MCLCRRGSRGTVLDLNHALARSMGGRGRVLELLDSWGKEFVGLIGHIFSALV